MGWCLPGCAILLSDLSRGGCLLLDSAQCNLSTLKKKKKKKNKVRPVLLRARSHDTATAAMLAHGVTHDTLSTRPEGPCAQLSALLLSPLSLWGQQHSCHSCRPLHLLLLGVRRNANPLPMACTDPALRYPLLPLCVAGAVGYR